jgi:type I restriction enzyme S subunit
MSFPRYPKHKDSGVEWLGQVPEHWGVKRLKHCARLVTVKAEERTNPVALENIEGWTGRLIPSEGDYQGDGTAFDAEDIMFGKLRPYLAKVYLATQSGEAVGDFHVLRPSRDLEGRFTQYQMLTREFIGVVDGSTYGSKMPRAGWDFVGAMPLAIPPRSEQATIAHFLDRETAKIDALIAEQQRLIELLQEKRQAVISHAVTKGLNPDAPMKDSGNPGIGQVPIHWCVDKMKWVAHMESGHTPDKKVEAYWENCEIPWVSLNDTGYLKEHDYISDTAFRVNELGIANSSARLLPERVVAFSRDATIGRCAITTRPMAVSQHFIAWVCGDDILPEYLLMRLRSMSQELERLTTGATLKTIGMPDVRTLQTPVPPLDEQESIVAYIQQSCADIDLFIAAAEKAISLLKERRSALISAAVTGQIDVRNYTSDGAAA